MRMRHVACLLSIACFAQLSTGCQLIRNAYWRVRSHFGCETCSPAFHNPGPVMSGPVYGGASYGAPDCASCSGYGGGVPVGQPVSMSGPITGAIPQMPMGSVPSVGLPMPKDGTSK